jgi:hypothetical protein
MYDVIQIFYLGGNIKMNKKKIMALLSGALVTLSLFGTTVFASPVSSVNSNITTTQSISLSKADESNIIKSINEVLYLRYDVLKDGKAKDYSNVIKDPKLLELVNKTSDFDAKWFKKFNGKINEYNSNVTILNKIKTSDNTYVVDVVYDVKFKLDGVESISSSKKKPKKPGNFIYIKECNAKHIAPIAIDVFLLFISAKIPVGIWNKNIDNDNAVYGKLKM